MVTAGFEPTPISYEAIVWAPHSYHALSNTWSLRLNILQTALIATLDTYHFNFVNLVKVLLID
jgi:hypothetical protein